MFLRLAIPQRHDRRGCGRSVDPSEDRGEYSDSEATAFTEGWAVDAFPAEPENWIKSSLLLD